MRTHGATECENIEETGVTLLPYKQEVRGSSPRAPTNRINNLQTLSCSP